MSVFKKHLTPLTKGGDIHKHQGKGSQQALMPDRAQIKGLGAPGAGMNDFAKATPMAQPSAPPSPMPGFGRGGCV